MSSGFKFTVFSLIVVFAVATSQVSVGMSRARSTSTPRTSSTTARTSSTAARTSSTTVASTPATTTSKTTASSTTDSSASATQSKASAVAVKRATGPVTQERNPNASRTKASGVVSQVQVTNTRGQVLLRAPKADSVTTVGALFDLINTNNPSKTSNFIVFVPGNPPSSKSAGNFGLSLEYLKASNSSGKPGILRDLQVTVKADDTGIIQIMQQRGSFPKTTDLTQALAYGWQTVFQYTIDNFPKILLYFQLPDLTTLPADTQSAIPDSLKYNWKQKFYLVDPWPQTDPIKWNKGWAPEQTCRAYRLLMDWTFN